MTQRKTAILATVTDFQGRTVAITRDAWNGHVLQNHPNMALRLEDVKQTMQAPDRVLQDFLRGFENWLYYKEFKLEGGTHYLKVAVCWNPQHGTQGYLMTAYPLNRVRGGIRTIWPVP